MKYHGQPDCDHIDENEIEDTSKSTSGKMKKNTENQFFKLDEGIKENLCSGVNVALDFTLNCNSVQLNSRDVTLRAVMKNQQTQSDSE